MTERMTCRAQPVVIPGFSRRYRIQSSAGRGFARQACHRSPGNGRPLASPSPFGWAIRHRLSCTLACLLARPSVRPSIAAGDGERLARVPTQQPPSSLAGEGGTRTPVTKVRPVGTGGTKVIVVVAVVVVGQW